MRDCLLADAPFVTPPWQASLRLGVTRDGAVTRLVRRARRGPLRVQKALYPEGGDVCHVIVVHPPGGHRSRQRASAGAGGGRAAGASRGQAAPAMPGAGAAPTMLR